MQFHYEVCMQVPKKPRRGFLGIRKIKRKLLIILVGPLGLEPRTNGL